MTQQQHAPEGWTAALEAELRAFAADMDSQAKVATTQIGAALLIGAWRAYSNSADLLAARAALARASGSEDAQ